MENPLSAPNQLLRASTQTKSIDDLVELLDSSLDVICSLDAEGRFLTLSAACLTLWGYLPEELEGTRYMDLVVEEDRAVTELVAFAIMNGQDVTNFENRYRRKDGTIVPIVWSARWNEKRKVMYCVARDASEKQRIERKLKRVNQKVKRQAKRTEEILESLQDGFFGMDRKWRVTYFNQMAERLTGKSRKQVLGKVFWEEFPSAIGGIAYREYHRALAENVQVNFEMYSQLYAAWFEVTAYPSREGLSVYFKNIDERKKHQEELQKLSLVAKETVNAVVITDKDEYITWVNQAFTDITEYSFEEAIGKKPSQLLQGKNTSKKTRVYLKEQIQKGLPFHCDIVNYSKSGREYWIELKGQPILNEKGEVEQFFAIETDITERIELQKFVVDKEIEAQREITKAIIEAQERERTELGKELHDNVNQIIATVKLYIENIRHLPEHRELFIDKGIELSKKAMDESRSLSHRLVTPSLADTSFKTAIEELLSHYQLLNIFTVDLAFTVCEEKLSPSFRLTIYRIVQECLTNVVKYAKATEVNVSILYEDKLVKVIISDNGSGFDGSTKTAGIGLTNMRNRVSLFKGKLQVTSTPGQGCTIQALFPTQNDQVIEIESTKTKQRFDY